MVSLFGRGFDSLQLHEVSLYIADYQLVGDILVLFFGGDFGGDWGAILLKDTIAYSLSINLPFLYFSVYEMFMLISMPYLYYAMGQKWDGLEPLTAFSCNCMYFHQITCFCMNLHIKGQNSTLIEPM